MNSILNPFINRNKVTDPTLFFGRTKEVKYLIKMLSYPEPQSVAVIGERRSGKSSLLTYIYHIISQKDVSCFPDEIREDIERIPDKDKLIAITIDPEESIITNIDEFIGIIVDELITEEPELMTLLESFSSKIEGKPVFSRRPQVVLNYLLKVACAENYRFVFLLDEFDLFARDPKLRESNFLQYLRGISDNYKLALIISSRVPPSEVISYKDISYSPFDNNFTLPCQLGLMEEDECVSLVEGLLNKYDYKIGVFQAHLNELLQLAGAHPYYLKMASSYLFAYLKADKPTSEDWRNSFLQEANCEFERLWGVLKDEEKIWIKEIAFRSTDITSSSLESSAILLSLLRRGIIKKAPGVKLFSEAFELYIKEKAANFTMRYNQVEREIADLGCAISKSENIEKLCDELSMLENENRLIGSLDTRSVNEVALVKCRRLNMILRDMRELVQSLEFNSADKKNTCDLSKFSTNFEEREDWFGSDKNQISPAVGEIILKSAIEKVEQYKKDGIFGNGYDKLLLNRIRFVQRHYKERKMADTDELVDKTFSRLVEVYDYNRASKMLQVKLGSWMNKLSEWFFKSPLKTIAGIVLLPLVVSGWLDNYIVGPCLDYLIPVVLVQIYSYFIWVMIRGLFFEKYCEIKNSKNLYKRLIWKKTFIWSAIFAVSSIFYLSEKPGYASAVRKDGWYVLLIGAVVGCGILVLVTLLINPKIKKMVVSFKRAIYFFSVEYLKSFWVVLIVYMFALIIFSQIDNTTIFEITEITRNWSDIPFGPYYIDTRFLLAAGFVGPLSGVCTIFSRYFN